MKSKLPGIPDHIRSSFKTKGYSKCFCAFYVTKPNGILLNLVSNVVASVLGDYAMFGAVNFKVKNNVMFPEMQFTFIDGNLSLLNRGTIRPMKGSYLVLAKPIDRDERDIVSTISAEIETCAAMISLMHGELVALERHFSASYDLNVTRVVATGGPIYIRQTIEQDDISQGMAKILNMVESVEFIDKPNVLALIRRAHHEPDSSIKFMFMWLALEAAIGDGKARRSFALEKMGSEKLNKVMNTLREKRSALVHDGILVGLDYKEYLQVKCIIIMAMVERADIKKSLLRYLEVNLL